jgi:hypothetical protein
MKRFLIIAGLLCGMSSGVSAQIDDIYASGEEQRRMNYDSSSPRSRGSFSDNDQTNDAFTSYNDADDYLDDDNSYSTRINRFYYPFYSMGYYNVFYNPYWYSPYWYDSYSGWNPWRPRFGMSWGIGPMWTSYWGWNSWYGYGAWNSYWNSPYNSCGWGNNYGYWNSYYGRGDYRHSYAAGASYGPRQVFGNGHMSGSGLRTAYNNTPRPAAFNNGQFNTRGQNGVYNYSQGGPRNAFRNNGQNGQQNYNNSSRGSAQPRSNFVRGMGNVFGGGNRGGNYNQGPSRGNSSGAPAGRSFFGGGNRGGSSFSGGGSRSGGNTGGGRSFGGGGHSTGGGSRGGGGGGGHFSGGGRR